MFLKVERLKHVREENERLESETKRERGERKERERELEAIVTF